MISRRIEIPLIARRVQQALPSWQETWLVGGAVRDLCLGRPVHDLDLAVDSGALEIAEGLASRLGGAFVPLDRERGCARVVLTDEALEIDIADFRAPGLRDDLMARDFTINALAVALGGDGTVIDPMGGLADLADRTVRLVGPASLIDDPLRGLRGVRIAADLGFDIDSASRREIRALAPALASCSAERCRDELVRCFAAPRPEHSLKELASLELLAILLPEVDAMGGGGFDHTLRVVEATQRTVVEWADPADGPALRPALIERLSATQGGGPSRRVLLLIAATLHDIGKSQAESGKQHAEVGAELAASRLRSLRFSAADVRAVAAIVRHHTRPPALLGRLPLDRRFLHRFLLQTAGVTSEIGLLMLGDLAAKVDLEGSDYSNLMDRARELLGADLLDPAEKWNPRPLVTGHDLAEMEICAPGPAMGPLLRDLLEAQVMNEISDREQAFALARALVG